MSKQTSSMKTDVNTTGAQNEQKLNEYLNVIALSKLKHHGTLLRHSTRDVPKFSYNALDLQLNPLMYIYDSKELNIRLNLDQDTIYLPGLLYEDRFCSPESVTSSMVSSNLSVSQKDHLLSLKTAATGTLKITVKGRSSVLISKISIRLMGYASEFICPLEKSKNKDIDPKTVKLLRNPTTNQFTFLQPMIHKKINYCSDKNKAMILLPPGSYAFLFSFILDSLNFHPSVMTHLGSTTYRVEALTTILRKRNRFETVILTKELKIKKTFPAGSTLNHDCIESHGSWKNDLLIYNISLSSKLLELDKPFQLIVRLLKKDVNFIDINFVKIMLFQYITIPCMNSNKIFDLNKSYVHSNQFQLREIKINDEKNRKQSLEINLTDLIISTKAYTCPGLADNSLYPFYCEESRMLVNEEENRYRLKIIHLLKIHIGIKDNRYENRSNGLKRLQLRLKIPIFLVDKDMTSSLNLPPYKKNPMDLQLLLKTYNNDSSGTYSQHKYYTQPPTYDQVY